MIKIDRKWKEYGVVDWIRLAHDRVQWMDFLNMEITLWFSKSSGNVFTNWKILELFSSVLSGHVDLSVVTDVSEGSITFIFSVADGTVKIPS